MSRINPHTGERFKNCELLCQFSDPPIGHAHIPLDILVCVRLPRESTPLRGSDNKRRGNSPQFDYQHVASWFSDKLVILR